MARKKGRKPFGFFGSEQPVIERIKLLRRVRKGGKLPGPYTIAKELNRDGFKSQTGKPWSGKVVRDLLHRIEATPADLKPKRKSVFKTALSQNDYLSQEEIQTIIEKLSGNKDRTGLMLFLFAINTGLRASELSAIQLRDLSLDDPPQVEVRRGKGNKQRVVYLSKGFAIKLKEYVIEHRKYAGRSDPLFLNFRKERLTYDNFYYFAAEIISKIIGRPCHCHQFRHTAAVYLYHYTKDIILVQQTLGHRSLETTQIYSKLLSTQRLANLEKYYQETSLPSSPAEVQTTYSIQGAAAQPIEGAIGYEKKE